MSRGMTLTTIWTVTLWWVLARKRRDRRSLALGLVLALVLSIGLSAWMGGVRTHILKGQLTGGAGDAGVVGLATPGSVARPSEAQRAVATGVHRARLMGAFFTNLAHPTLFGFDEDRLSALEERFGGTIDNQLLHVLAGRGLVGVACLLALLFTPIVIWLRLLPGSRAAPYAFVLPAYLLLAASDVAFFGLFTAFVWVAAVVAWPAVRDLAAERSAADDG
jgi:hypothetical protein